MINHYFFDNQLRSYMLQFMSIFYGLRVKTGKGECDEYQYITVPCVIGNKDRVVAAIQAGNTSNRVFGLPIMAAHLSGLALAPERRRTPGMLDQRVHMQVGGVFPDDLTVIKRAMPVPYNATIELSIYTSNTQTRDQILEQILVLFNPDVQIQKSDGEFDWARITKVELTDIANEENYPSSTERRMIVWTLTFEMPIYLSVPLGIKDDLVRKIIIQIGQLDGMPINEVDADGHLLPYGTPLATVEFDTTPPANYRPPTQGPEPEQPDQLPPQPPPA